MKKIIIVAVAVVAVLSFTNKADAACDVLTPCGNGDPMQVTMPWGLSGYQTPTVVSGATVTDEVGLTDKCPAWYGKMGCFDLTRTDLYRNNARSLAKNFGGQFTAWLNR